ncbi:MAG: hypothetical protein ACYCST_16805 [Acidimicrobiales bacterium]
MVADDVSIEELAAALLFGAQGLPGDEAGIDLLVSHGTYLARDGFRRFVDPVGESGMIWVDFDGVLNADLPGTKSEHRLLLLAAELHGRKTGCSLGLLLTGHNRHDAALILWAVAHVLGLDEDAKR